MISAGEKHWDWWGSPAAEKALWEELQFKESVHSEVVASILERVVVCDGSDDKEIHLEIHLRLGQTVSGDFLRGPFVFCERPLRNTFHKPEIRTI